MVPPSATQGQQPKTSTMKMREEKNTRTVLALLAVHNGERVGARVDGDEVVVGQVLVHVDVVRAAAAHVGAPSHARREQAQRDVHARLCVLGIWKTKKEKTAHTL